MAHAQLFPEDSLRQQRIAKFDSWKWRISPYAWIPAIRGRVTTPDLSVVDLPVLLPEPPPPFIDFKILLKDLRSHLKFLSVFSAEYRFDRFLIAGRFDAIVIGAKPVLIFEELLSSTTLDFAVYSADLIGGYQFSNNPKFQS